MPPRTRPPKKPFSDRTYIMGVLNVTPDSFSDGGRFFNRNAAVRHAIEMVRDGADIIDVGGESTRPGSSEVSVAEEIRRVIPVIDALSRNIERPISVDTRKSKVAKAALEAGASIVNDVSGLRHDPSMADVIKEYGSSAILMHMKGTPKYMQKNPSYKDVVSEIKRSLKESIQIAKKAEIPPEKLIIDPGIGFGKTVEHNLEILGRLEEFKDIGLPVCIGTSRKSFIRKILDTDDERSILSGTLATCVAAIMNGASILRVHDVKEAAVSAAIVDRLLKGYN